ncbi:MAG: hypothetical protein M1530_02245 [Candidatus Marsarchaeota archaeon]|nr:hypothetical protein [Candidatus Marsarchaeota archaeon]
MNLLFPKVPSGIPGLDKMIGGGFTKNSIVVISGSTGSGRTTFATQFLVNGWRQNQEPGIYLSFNEPKYSIFANMSAFDWNLPELERNKNVVFIEYPSSELSSFLEQEGSILELIDTLGVERVVFDSITPLSMISDGEERMRSMQKLIDVVRKWGVTTLITADDIMPPHPDLPRTSVGIEAMSDGFIHLGWMREGNRRMRTLEVVKMRGSAHAHLIHLTTIDSQGYRLVDSGMPETEKKREEAPPGAAQKTQAGPAGAQKTSLPAAGQKTSQTMPVQKTGSIISRPPISQAGGPGSISSKTAGLIGLSRPSSPAMPPAQRTAPAIRPIGEMPKSTMPAPKPPVPKKPAPKQTDD